MITSLQKAATAAAAKKAQASYHTSKGQFETCFATGLDLSEFDKNPLRNGGGTPVESAASRLLRVKQAEKRRKEEEDAADQRLRQIVQEESAKTRESLEREKESNTVVNALVHMHGHDMSDPSAFVYRKHKKLGKKSGVSRRSKLSPAKGKARKKARHSKF